MSRSAASDLGLHCLPMSLLCDTRLKSVYDSLVPYDRLAFLIVLLRIYVQSC